MGELADAAVDKNDEYRITEENLAEYEKNADDLIKSYDYDQLLK